MSEPSPYLALVRPKGPSTYSSELAERLRSEILSNRPLPGTYLFAVSDLIRESGYGPSVVREALQHLSSSGLIDVRRGPKGGVYARQVGAEILTRSLDTLVTANDIPRGSIIEARLEIEGVCARLAALNATNEDIARLDESVERTRQAKKDSFAFAEENVVFHVAVMRATNNDVMIALAQSLRDAFFRETTHFDYSAQALRDALAVHERLTDAIRAGDADKANHLMHGHISEFNRYIGRTGQADIGSSARGRQPGSRSPRSKGAES